MAWKKGKIQRQNGKIPRQICDEQNDLFHKAFFHFLAWNLAKIPLPGVEFVFRAKYPSLVISHVSHVISVKKQIYTRINIFSRKCVFPWIF